MADIAPNPQDYFKAQNPDSGLTDIFNKSTGYVDPMAGAALFKSGLNADLIPTGTHPGNLGSNIKPPAPTDSLTIDAGDVAKGLSKTGTMADITGSAGDQLGQNDLLKKLQGYLSNSPQLAQAVAANTELSPEEIDVKKKLLGITQSQTGEQEGIVDRNVGGGLPSITAATTRELGDVANGLTPTSLANLRQKTFYTQYLTLLQGTRTQQLQAAQFLYDANRNALTDTLNIYKETAPQNIATNVNPQTGDVYVTTRNPVTGEIANTKAGNIGAQKTYQDTQIMPNPSDPTQLLFIGTKPDGTVDIHPLTGDGSSPLLGGNGNSTGNGNQSSVVNGYDLSTYATDPSYASKVGAISSVVGNPQSASDAQAIISKLNPKSTITGSQIMQIAGQTGVDPGMLISIMQQESNMGASPVATKNNNLGGITWSQAYQDSHPGTSKGTAKPASEGGGNYVKFASQQDGVAAVAEQLSSRKAGSTSTVGGQFSPDAQTKVKQLPASLQPFVDAGPLGVAYMNDDRVPASFKTAAQAQAAKAGIPYLTGADVANIHGIQNAMGQLDQMQALAAKTLGSGVGGTIMGQTLGRVNSLLQTNWGNQLNNFNNYRETAVNLVRGLAGGAGLRINGSEIAANVEGLPGATDSVQGAFQKIATFQKQVSDVLSATFPYITQTAPQLPAGNKAGDIITLNNGNSAGLAAGNYVLGGDGTLYSTK